MSVVVSVEDLGGSQKKIKVAVPLPAVEAETDRVTAEYRKQARVPGFRKGKVPVSLVKQHFGEDIEREVVERLIPRYWKQAEAESELEPLLPPALGAVDFELGSELTFDATIDLRPEFELGDIESFEGPDEPKPVTDEDVDKALEELRRSAADWKAVERSAAQGDRVTVEIAASVPDGEVDADAEAPEPETSTFEVGDSHVWEELSLAVTGLSVDQKGDFEREFLEGASVEKKKFKFRVKTIEERELAPLDDQFAKRLGAFEDLADLHTKMRDNLASSRTEEYERARRGSLIEQLCARHSFVLPKRVVEEEAQGMLREYATGLAQQGLDLENAGIDWQKMGEEVTPQAEKRVRARLVLDAIATKLGTVVAEDEFEGALVGLAKAQGRSSGQLRQELDRAGRLGDLREQMLRDKTVKQLLGDSPEAEPIETDDATDTNVKEEEE